ncbi:MAG: hypothetical protein H0U44_06915, partial [Flavisolibacter sp.]|nr:hypothetical protein [Flavisolibacter sp.]
YWFNLTNDSSYIKKYLRRVSNAPATPKEKPAPAQKIVRRQNEVILPEKNHLIKKKTAAT